jgi:hypothetical protein
MTPDLVSSDWTRETGRWALVSCSETSCTYISRSCAKIVVLCLVQKLHLVEWSSTMELCLMESSISERLLHMMMELCLMETSLVRHRERHLEYRGADAFCGRQSQRVRSCRCRPRKHPSIFSNNKAFDCKSV